MLFKGSIRALLVLSLASPAGAFALGLGDIRLLSPLDAPLNAEVEVVDASPDELNTLQAQIASRETFARYGLDYPSYLSDVQAQSVRTADGRQVIQLKSNEPVHQAYLTLLVEVNWARGRTVREYTMLLDPPVYTPGEKNAPAPAPVAAAAAGVDTRGGEIARNTPSPIQAEPPPAPPPAAESTQDQAPVAEQPPVAALAPKGQRSAATPEPEDTSDQDQPQDTQKPAGGGQHVVKRGETLSQIAADQAQSDPRSVQTQTWMLAIYRANPDAFDGSMNSLKNRQVLRIPDATELAAISPAEAADEVHRAYMAWRSGVAGAPGSQVASARTGGRRSLKLVVPKEPIAAGAEDAPEGTTAQQGSGTSEEAPVTNPKRLASARSDKLSGLQKRLSGASASSEAPEEPSARTGVGVDVNGRGAGADSATPLPPESAPAPERPAPAPPKAGSLPVSSFMSQALDLTKQLWWVAAAALMGLVLVVALRSWRSRRQAEFDDSLNRLALAGSGLGPLSVEHGFTTNDGMGPLEGVVDEPFTVEDTGRFPVTASRAPIAEDLPPVRHDEVPQGAFADGGDPLAEADFHIGYGMYDQAAELLRSAVEHEPGRRDLRLKLLEVYFETGNRDEFLQLAEELVHTRDQAGPGEWEKIAIMGRQLAPEDPLFAESDDFNAAAAGVDLDLEAGDQQVDYDLGGMPDEQQIEFDNAMLDEGMVEEGSVETDIDYSRPPPATMLRQPQAEELQPEGAFELELDGQDGEIDLESALQEAELELNGAPLDADGHDSDATMVAGFDERSRRVMEAAAQRRALQDTEAALEPMEADPMDQWAAHEEIDSMPLEAGATDASQLGTMRGAARADRDMGRYDLSDAANGPYSNGANGAGHGEALAEDDMALPDLEPVTMSEVGTKLDLARAYVDMGDPEGARNILEEVLNEGSLAQKQEAQLLLEGLPG